MKKTFKTTTLNDLFLLKIKSLYDIETQLIKALPKMAKAATDADLKKGFQKHLAQTQEQAERLEHVFDLLNNKYQKTQVEAIRGLIKDGEWLIKNIKDKEALDASLIAAAQYIEHYEIAGYGTAAEWAKLLGQEKIVWLLEKTLEEESQTDQDLTNLANKKINQQTMAVEN